MPTREYPPIPQSIVIEVAEGFENVASPFASYPKFLIRNDGEAEQLQAMLDTFAYAPAPNRPDWFSAELREVILDAVNGEGEEGDDGVPRALVRDDDMLADLLGTVAARHMADDDFVDILDAIKAPGVIEAFRALRGADSSHIVGSFEKRLQEALGADPAMSLRVAAVDEDESIAPRMSA